MEFVEFLKTLDDPLKFYLHYSLKKFGLDLEGLEKEGALEAISKAVGPHIAELLYGMYLEARSGRKSILLVSA
ncbi:MAG: hypothetical protein ACP5J0_03955 [Pyrobaculum sp.]